MRYGVTNVTNCYKTTVLLLRADSQLLIAGESSKSNKNCGLQTFLSIEILNPPFLDTLYKYISFSWPNPLGLFHVIIYNFKQLSLRTVTRTERSDWKNFRKQEQFPKALLYSRYFYLNCTNVGDRRPINI